VHFCLCLLPRDHFASLISNYGRDAVATDIVHQHSARLDYYKGFASFFKCCPLQWLSYLTPRNFTQFYSTKSERDLNLRKEYDNQMEYRKHLQAFIDRWRYNANRGMYFFVPLLSFILISVYVSRPGAVEDQNLGKGQSPLSSYFVDDYSRGDWLSFRSCSHLKKMKRRSLGEYLRDTD
jgi:hypothetical protein